MYKQCNILCWIFKLNSFPVNGISIPEEKKENIKDEN